MAESIVSNLSVKLLEYLSKYGAQKIAPYFGGEEELQELQMMMELIQARLYDAELRQEAEEGAVVKSWLKRLKSLLCRMEDLFEEVVIADEQRAKSKLTKAVCFFPLLKMNKKVSLEGQAIMRELRSLRNTMESLQLREFDLATKQHALNQISRRDETYSFVVEEEVLGRDEDKSVIVQMLLDSEPVNENLSVIAIVGMGGLGKTTLAQIAYNDENVERHFELRGWLCIPDKMPSFHELAGKVLQCITVLSKKKVLQCITEDSWQKLRTEELQCKLQQAVKDNKFLLVLDDVWCECYQRWHNLKSLLCSCKQGSKILVTCRSKVAALNMGAVKPYELNALSEEKSWEMFKSIALREGQEETNPNLKTIGVEIVKRCRNVPLAIKTIAGLLLSKDTEEEWMEFMDRELGMIGEEDNDIIPTLKLSYNHLTPQLKQCFAFCSLFPEDYQFNVERLIWLWVANGFVVSEENGSSYSRGHAYCMELVRRYFFQVVQRDQYGGIRACKMHDLLYELAKKVGNECLSIEMRGLGRGSDMNSIRHILVNNTELPPLAARQMQAVRSCFESPDQGNQSVVSNVKLDKLFSCLRRLRALDLGGDKVYQSLPNSIAKLIHLRYLKVHVHRLAEGMTRLPNLQILDLRGSYFREFTDGFNKLTTLEHLRIGAPKSLVDMPPRFRRLKSLQTLDLFIVGDKNGIDSLSRLNLTGDLNIYYRKHRQNAVLEAKRANLKGKCLTSLALKFSFSPDPLVTELDELLECLHPPSSLKSLNIDGWNGGRLPSWGMNELPCLLPNLVQMRMYQCHRCQHLPPFSQLHYLERLSLGKLSALEYVEDICGSTSKASSTAATPCFPRLDSLSLHGMPELKGWWRIEDVDADQQTQQHQRLQHSFPRLSDLHIHDCPKLMSLPQALGPRSMLAAQNLRMLQHHSPLQTLYLCNCEKLDLWDAKDDDGDGSDKDINSSTWPWLKGLRCLELVNMPTLESLPSGIGGLTSLHQLVISGLNNLKTLPESVRNLTALEQLHIQECPQLQSRCKNPDGDDWPLIQHIPTIFNNGRCEQR